METYATVLAYAIPGFLILILIESLVARWRGVQVNHAADTISSLSSGMTNTLKTLMGLAVIILSYEWMVGHLALFDLPAAGWVYALAFVGLDFKGYWSHRWNHEINLFWNRHVIHHSSEEFNLSCALRQDVSAFVGVYFFLYIPMALLGVPTEVVAFIAPIHFFSQFWYHTRLIDRMGPLESIMVTPSHHRVHHAINDEYLDKNFSEIFIIWDKLFGTFQEELKEVPPVYGTKRPAGTWNPILINFMHVWSILQDAWHTRSWWDKARIWFMPTGWRPTDVLEKYPIPYYKTAGEQKKYDSHLSRPLSYWSWGQLTINFVLMYHLMFEIGTLTFIEILCYGGFLMLSVFAYTTLMDRHRLSLPLEGLKFVYGLAAIYLFQGWFGLGVMGSWLVVAYLVISLACCLYFVRTEVWSSVNRKLA
ncbi:sterol desaturase family protein [Lewinella cohaerens]|uniref:sterol desaturase family protein n=1 Tax=Lewinella cohaerens TaxID=70995 RepID=UPI00036BF318|nr:sterol desaturase family protein [Lewinella cohaerens]